MYLHIAHSNDKEETDIPQPFKGTRPKQPKTRGGGKSKLPQQKLKPPPVQVQEDQYTYDDTNNYYHNKNYTGQPRGHRPYRGQNTGQLFTGQNLHGRGQHSQNPYQGQYQSNSYQGNNYQGNHGLYHNPHRNYQQDNNYGHFRGRSCGHAEVITMDVVVAGLIIKAITTTNTISIMVMMMSTRQMNMAHHVHYAMAIITPPNIVLRDNMILMTSWRK